MAKRTLKHKSKSKINYKNKTKQKRSRRQRGGANITVNYNASGMERSVVLDIADTSSFRELEAKLKEHIKPFLFRRFYNVPSMNSPLVQTAFRAEVFAKTVPIFLVPYLFKQEDIISIRKEKPAASLNSGNDQIFNSNWPVYTENEKALVLEKLKDKIGYEIAVRYVGTGYMFYSVPHLTALSALFDDKTVDQCIEAYFPARPQPPSEAFDFIYLAFGDIFKPEGHMDKKTEANLTPAGKAKLEEYKSYPYEMFAAAAEGDAGGGAAAGGGAKAEGQ